MCLCVCVGIFELLLDWTNHAGGASRQHGQLDNMCTCMSCTLSVMLWSMARLRAACGIYSMRSKKWIKIHSLVFLVRVHRLYIKMSQSCHLGHFLARWEELKHALDQSRVSVSCQSGNNYLKQIVPEKLTLDILDVYFDLLFWSMSHLLTWRKWGCIAYTASSHQVAVR